MNKKAKMMKKNFKKENMMKKMKKMKTKKKRMRMTRQILIATVKSYNTLNFVEKHRKLYSL
jgi:hypothetical protein